MELEDANVLADAAEEEVNLHVFRFEKRNLGHLDER